MHKLAGASQFKDALVVPNELQHSMFWETNQNNNNRESEGKIMMTLDQDDRLKTVSENFHNSSLNSRCREY